MSEKSAAVVTVFNPGEMTSEGRRQIADWLRVQADNLEIYGSEYTNGYFRARYLYNDPD